MPMSKAQAAYEAPDGNTYTYRVVFNISSDYYQVYSNDKFGCLSTSSSNGKYTVFTINQAGTDYGWISIPTSGNEAGFHWQYPSTTTPNSVRCNAHVFMNGGTLLYNQGTAITIDPSANPDTPIFNEKAELLAYLQTTEVTWGDIQEDISVPRPRLILDYSSLPSNATSLTYCHGIKVSGYGASWNREEQLYLAMAIRYYTPSTVQANKSNGWTYFDTISYAKSTPFYLNSYNEGSELPDTGSWALELDDVPDLNSFWQSFRSGITMTYEGNAPDQTTKSNYEYGLRKVCYLNNCIEIYARYFYIKDGQFYGGMVERISTVASQTQDLSQIGNASGNVGNEMNTSSNTVTSEEATTALDNTSDQTPSQIPNNGTNINVTVNNPQVPNNQNYPTVVSYNHDNIFTQFIGTYTSAGTYLGGFVSFLNGVMLWVPAEIWAIIGVGMAMAIVIMVVKIL